MDDDKRKLWQWNLPKPTEATKATEAEKPENVNPCHVCDCMYPCSSARSVKPWD